jgi:hypothetical protein
VKPNSIFSLTSPKTQSIKPDSVYRAKYKANLPGIMPGNIYAHYAH